LIHFYKRYKFNMDATKTALGKLIARRRLEGGEFSYVLVSTGETVSGKKAAYTLLKENQPEDFEKFKSDCQADGEDDAAFDARCQKMVPVLPYEEKAEDMEVDDADKSGKKGITVDELFTLVSVSNVDKKTKEEEVSAFLQKFDGVEKVKKFFAPKFVKKQQGQRQNRPTFSGTYNVTFRDAESASKFLAKPDDEMKLKEKVLTRQLLKRSVQQRVIRSQFGGGAFHHNRLINVVPIASDKEDKTVLVSGLGKQDDKEIQEFFLNGESKPEGVASVKTVHYKFGSTDKVLGYLLTFGSKASCDKFVEEAAAAKIKFKEKEMRCQIPSKIKQDLVKKLSANNLTTDEGLDMKIVLLKLNHGVANVIAEDKIKEMFKNVSSVEFVTQFPVTATIVTMSTADAASKAISDPPTDLPSIANPCTLMSLEEYKQMREQILESSAERLERLDEKYKVIKEAVDVSGNTITITDNDRPDKETKKAKKEKVEKQKKAEKAEAKPNVIVVADTPKNPMLAKRKNRGPGAFDCFVGVAGFQTKIKNMGQATDMDICNYFIHNHKDVVDVKFFDWSKVVFAKFKNAAAAERFIGLNYVMFYGIDLTLVDIEAFLKKRTQPQKEEMSKILLNKKFNDVKLRSEGGGDSNGVQGGNPQVELAAFASKQAGAGIRKKFIEQLNLNEADVGQPNWVKEPKGFKARIQVKLEENAIGYLVKKWNEMDITVEGETVSAALTESKGGIKRSAGMNKARFGQGGRKKAKFNMNEEY